MIYISYISYIYIYFFFFRFTGDICTFNNNDIEKNYNDIYATKFQVNNKKVFILFSKIPR